MKEKKRTEEGRDHRSRGRNRRKLREAREGRVSRKRGHFKKKGASQGLPRG